MEKLNLRGESPRLGSPLASLLRPLARRRLLLFAALMWIPLGALLCVHGDEPKQSEPLLDGREGRNLALDRFRPKAQLKVAEHLLGRAKFPVVDVHVHPK